MKRALMTVVLTVGVALAGRAALQGFRVSAARLSVKANAIEPES